MIEVTYKEFLLLMIPLFVIGVVFLKKGNNKRFEFWLVFVVMLLLVIALSRPTIKKGEKTFYKKDTEIIIMIDHSLSMGVNDIKPDRLTFAVEKAKKLVESLKDEKVGLIIFADQPEIITYPFEKIKNTITALKNLKLKPSGSTDILSAFSVANSVLTGREKIVVLFSDGSDEELSKVYHLVKQSGIRVVFYGVATYKGGKVPNYNAVSKLNIQMIDIAKKSGIFVQPSSDESDSDIKIITNYIKNISEKTKTIALKVKSYIELSPFITAFSLLIIFFGYFVRRFLFFITVILCTTQIAYAGEIKGIFFYFTGAFQKAAQEFLEDKSPQNMYNAALLYYKIGMYQKVLNILKNIKTDRPELTKKIKYTMALSYLAQKKYKEANKLSQELVSLFPQERKIKKLYLFTNFLINVEKKEENKKTIVRIKEKESQIFKTSPSQIGEKNPW